MLDLTALLQPTLSRGSTLSILQSVMSCLTHSLQVFRGLPTLLWPSSSSTSMSMTELMHSCERTACPYHLSRRERSTFSMPTSPNLVSRSSVLVSSRGPTPQIQRIIDLSLRRRCCRSAEFGPQVSLPCNIAVRTQVLKTLPRTRSGTCLDVRTGMRLLNLPQAIPHLLEIALAQPPPAPIMSPR